MPVSGEDQLTRLLQAIRDGGYADAPVDSTMLAAALHSSPASAARDLQEAIARRWVSGTRIAVRPGPQYTDLELTAPGRAFLARAARSDH
jgi:hypothetical protein